MIIAGYFNEFDCLYLSASLSLGSPLERGPLQLRFSNPKESSHDLAKSTSPIHPSPWDPSPTLLSSSDFVHRLGGNVWRGNKATGPLSTSMMTKPRASSAQQLVTLGCIQSIPDTPVQRIIERERLKRSGYEALDTSVRDPLIFCCV